MNNHKHENSDTRHTVDMIIKMGTGKERPVNTEIKRKQTDEKLVMGRIKIQYVEKRLLKP